MRSATSQRTQGDTSEASSGGGKDTRTVAASFVPYPAPVQWRPGLQLADSLVDVQGSEMVDGGSEWVISPPENMERCYREYRLSPLLRPIVQAFCDNVYGAGFTLEPIINPDEQGSTEEIRDIIRFERSEGDLDYDEDISDEDIEKELKRLRIRIKNETLFLKTLFGGGTVDMSFRRMCILTGQDMEIAGPGYWEVLRDADTGKPSRFLWVPSWTVRSRPMSKEQYYVEEPRRVSPIRWGTSREVRRFRSFVQIDANSKIVGRYKEFGDPRVMSRKTGRFYNTLEDMAQNTDDEYYTYRSASGEEHTVLAQPATELLMFSLPSAASHTYGAPQWTGVWPGLAGTRDLDEENMTVVTDQKVPQMFITISGGRGVPKEDIEQIKQEVAAAAKEGRRGIYIIQAQSQALTPGMPSSDPKIEIIPTRKEQHTDALGMKYKEDAYADVRRTYRMPKVSLGDSEGVNRATSDAMHQFAEVQVYDPRRDIFADPINDKLLPSLGVQCVQFRVRSRVPRDPKALAEIINTLVQATVLTPEEAREFAGDIFNKDFKALKGRWSKVPTQLLTALLQTKNQLIGAAILEDEGDEDLQSKLVDLLSRGELPQSGGGAPSVAPQRSSMDEKDNDERKEREARRVKGPSF